MLNWLAGFVGRWVGLVPAPIRDLVHWTVHALASVVYFVFGAVGKAWHDVFAAASWLETAAAAWVDAVYGHLRAIVVHDLPQLWSWVTSAARQLEQLAIRLWHDALAAAARVEHLAAVWVADLRTWVLVHLWDPLVARVRQLEGDMLRYAVTAWWWVTHPDKLAAALFGYLVAQLEAQAWTVGRQLGTFTLALVAHNAGRLAQLVEQIITAVL